MGAPGHERRVARRYGLYRSAMRIGREHVASTVNTLALAYAGAAVPLLILLVQSRPIARTVANSEMIAAEIVRTLVGSIGLVASVPLTTWLAARIVTGQTSLPGSRSERPGGSRWASPLRTAPPARRASNGGGAGAGPGVLGPGAGRRPRAAAGSS